MAINYSVARMKNPAEPDVYKYYPKAQANGSVDINELAEEIAYATTLTDGDVLNVIRALVKRINLHIANGQIVKLENLGSFQAQLRRWITLNKDLQKRLDELHYKKGQRTLTPLQHEAICHYLGEP